MLDLRRRQFITLLGGTAAWPLAARAQQGERMRRIGMLIPLNADDKVAQDRIAVFVQGLKELGGNLTGVSNLNVELGSKQLELMHELVPTATIVALLRRVAPVVALLTPPALDEGRRRRDARLRHFALEMCEAAH